MTKKIFLLLFLFVTQISNTAVVDFVCQPGGSESPLQTLRNFFYMAMGFPGSTEYACFLDFDESGTVGDTTRETSIATHIGGESGLVGKMDGLRSRVVNAIVAAKPEITAC